MPTNRFSKTLILTFLSLILCTTGFAEEKVDPSYEKIDFANGLFQRDLFDMAASEYEQFINKHPDSQYLHEAYFGLAESYFFNKNYEKATGYYQKYLELFSDKDKYKTVRLRLGECFLAQNELDPALGVLNVLKDNELNEKDLQQKLFLIAQIYQAKGQIDKSVETFKQIEAISQSSTIALDTYLKLGDSLRAKKDFKAAIEYYKKAADNSEDLQLKGFALYKQAETTFLSEEYDVSADIFAEVVDLKIDKTLTEDAISNLLLSLFNVPAYNAVITRYKYFKDQLTAEGRLFDVLYIVARTHKQLEQYNQAIEFIDKALANKNIEKSETDKAVDVKVEILFLSKKYQAVIDLINDKWGAGSGFKEKGLFFKAESHYSLKNYQQAHDTYEQLLKEFPGTSYKEDVVYGLAHAKNALGNKQQAAGLFEQYLTASNDENKKKEALFNQILLKAKLKDLPTAIKHAEEYLKTYPDDPKNEHVRFLLGTLYSKEKAFAKAVEVFQNIVKDGAKGKKYQESLFLLAYNYQLSGDVKKALEYYQKVSLKNSSKSLYYSARKNMALIHLDRKEFPKAALLLREIIKNYDKNDLTIDMYLWLVEKSLESDSHETAIELLTKAEGKLKTDADKQSISYFKAAAYQKQNKCAEALSLFDEVLAIKHESTYVAQAQIGKTQCLINEKKFDQAKSLLDDVLLNFSNDGKVSLKARFEMGNLLELQDKFEESAKYYMLVAVLYNDPYYCSESLFRAGRIFEKIDKQNDARNVYQEIIQLYTESHRFDQAQKRLAALNQ